VGVVELPNAGDKPTLTFCTIATNVLVPLSMVWSMVSFISGFITLRNKQFSCLQILMVMTNQLG